jgi:hypothetical protein
MGTVLNGGGTRSVIRDAVAVLLLGALAGCGNDSKNSAAQQNSVTAIDIALEPDATMLKQADAANARLLKALTSGSTR